MIQRGMASIFLVPILANCTSNVNGDASQTSMGVHGPASAGLTKTLVCDGVSAGRSTLLGLNVRGLPSYSTLAWVGSRDRTYRLIPRTAVADGREVVDSSDGRQWLDTGEDSAVWQSKQAFWSIDPAAGSDDAAGWGNTVVEADSHPLKSFAELWRRWRNVTLGPEPVVIHLLTSISPGTDSVVPPSTINGTSLGTAGIGSTIHIVGKPILVHSGVLTDVRPMTDRAGNGKYILQDAAWDWTNGVSSRLIYGARLVKKTGAEVYSMVLTQVSATEVAVNIPLATNPEIPSYPTVGDAWATGDSYEVYALPTVFDMGSTNVQTSYAMVNLGRLGYGTVSVAAIQPMRLTYVCIQENLAFTGTLLAGGVLFMDDTRFQNGRWDMFHCAGVGAGDTRSVYLNGLGYIVKFANYGFRQYCSSQAYLRISGAQFYDVQYAGGPEGPPALITADETGTVLVDDSIRGFNNAAYLFSVQTPQSRGIFGVSPATVPVELLAGWEQKVALYFYYSTMPIEVGWDGIPLNDLARGGSFIGDGLK